MSEFEKKALCYVFMQNRKALKEGIFHGLRYKQAFDYDKQIKNIASMIEHNQILDLEEVLSYGN